MAAVNNELISQVVAWLHHNFDGGDPSILTRRLLDKLQRSLGNKGGDAEFAALYNEVMHNRPEVTVIGGLMEEIGEIARCPTKMANGIRGTREEWIKELSKEVADGFIKLIDVCDSYGLDLNSCIETRWEEIRQRDFRANPKGHGLPQA